MSRGGNIVGEMVLKGEIREAGRSSQHPFEGNRLITTM